MTNWLMSEAVWLVIVEKVEMKWVTMKAIYQDNWMLSKGLALLPQFISVKSNHILSHGHKCLFSQSRTKHALTTHILS